MIVNAVVARYKVSSNLFEAHSHHRSHERFLDKTFCLYKNQKEYREFVLHQEEQIQSLPPADLWVFYASDKPQDIVEELGLTESQYLFMIPDQDS